MPDNSAASRQQGMQTGLNNGVAEPGSVALSDTLTDLVRQSRVPAPGEVPPVVTAVAPGELGTMLPLPEEAAIAPEAAINASSWLDAYIEHSRRWSPRACDDLHEAVGLWVLSAVAARRVVLDLGGERFPNLYIAAAMRTSIGAKTTTAKVGIDLLQEAELSHLLAPDDATPQAFIRSLTARLPNDWGDLSREKQHQYLERLTFAGQRGWFFDEFGQKVAAMMREGGFMADFRGLLRKFDDTPASYEYVTIVIPNTRTTC